LDGVAARSSTSEYWWIYALPLSTIIPSLANLVIGGPSLVHGLPGLLELLLRKIPSPWQRPQIRPRPDCRCLYRPGYGGRALGIAAQVFLVVVIIGHLMRFFGPELLGMARDVAALNLPARVGQLFGVSL
jgi:hypothetical protein